MGKQGAKGRERRMSWGGRAGEGNRTGRSLWRKSSTREHIFVEGKENQTGAVGRKGGDAYTAGWKQRRKSGGGKEREGGTKACPCPWARCCLVDHMLLRAGTIFPLRRGAPAPRGAQHSRAAPAHVGSGQTLPAAEICSESTNPPKRSCGCPVLVLPCSSPSLPFFSLELLVLQLMKIFTWLAIKQQLPFAHEPLHRAHQPHAAAGADLVAWGSHWSHVLPPL